VNDRGQSIVTDNITRTRDAAIEQLLRQPRSEADASPASSACLDAETIAAWVEGALRPDEAAFAEGHLSGCGRCQRVLASLGRTIPTTPVAPRSQWSRALPWLVPTTAGALAVVIWFAIPTGDRPPVSLDQRQQAIESAPAAPTSQLPPAERPRDIARAPETVPAAAPPRATSEQLERKDARPSTMLEAGNESARPKEEAAQARQETARGRAADASAEAGRAARAAEAPTPPVTLPPAPAAGVVAGRLQASRVAEPEGVVVISTDVAVRWRIVGDRSIQFSTNGGTAWETVLTTATGRLTAGASPAPPVCWLVGSDGQVLLTVDGRRFARKPFPEAIDLTGVLAKDALNATVTASDGRSFTTSNGGATWK
jgi:hypothetical protein